MSTRDIIPGDSALRYGQDDVWEDETYTVDGEARTMKVSSSGNATITYKVPEPATAFSYYGIWRGPYAICIACDPSNPAWTFPLNSQNGTDTPSLLYTRVFAVPSQPEIILQNRPTDGNSRLTLDRFIITVAADSITSSSHSESEIPSTAFIATASDGSEQSNAILVPALAGALGGLGFIIILSLVAFFLYRRRRRVAANRQMQLSTPYPTPHQPTLPPLDPSNSQIPSPVSSANNRRSDKRSRERMSRRHPPPSSAASMTLVDDSVHGSQSRSPSGNRSGGRKPKRATDAGRVILGADGQPVVYPPSHDGDIAPANDSDSKKKKRRKRKQAIDSEQAVGAPDDRTLVG